MTEKEKEIKGFMEKYNLSYADAEQLWLEDNDELVNDEIEEMTKKAKQNKQGAKADGKRKDRKSTPKERKVDTIKKYLLEKCAECLAKEIENVSIKTETELNFDYKGENYTLKLTKHRKKGK